MIETAADVKAASEIMLAFADRTGLVTDRPAQRYLWTDAFAVCNFLGLARTTGDGSYTALALRLVDQVHQVLGRHRSDAPRTGWLSGLADEEGAKHPTLGGLRIGKTLPERRPGEPFDTRLEWDRDGQYFHYLTKWMHALDQTARATRQPRFNLWARELAAVAHRAFVRGGGASRGMVWKMSIDLSRPLVPSMGQHDPLDGFITCVQLQATATALGCGTAAPDMTAIVADFAAMTVDQTFATADPLGIGGLLADAGRVAQLTARGAFAGSDLLDRLLASALQGLSFYAHQGDLQQPASRRLAFRELGLAIGLHAVIVAQRQLPAAPLAMGSNRTTSLLAALWQHTSIGRTIESFWREPAHQRTASWVEHRNINEVMLATRLSPAGFLSLAELG